MPRITEASLKNAVVQAVEALAQRLGPEQAAVEMQHVLDDLSKAKDPVGSLYWALAPGPFVERLTPEQSARFMRPLLDVLSTSSSLTRPALGLAAGRLAERLGVQSQERITQVRQQLLDALAGPLVLEVQADVRGTLTLAVERLTEQMGPRQATQAMQQAHDAMTRRGHLVALVGEVGRLAELLPPEQAAEAAGRATQVVLDVLARNGGTWASWMDTLLPRLGRLTTRLTRQQSERALRHALAAVAGNTDPKNLNPLAQVVRQVAERVGPIRPLRLPAPWPMSWRRRPT